MRYQKCILPRTSYGICKEKIREQYDTRDEENDMRWDRRIRKTYLKLITLFHHKDCLCKKCTKESLIGRCGGIKQI